MLPLRDATFTILASWARISDEACLRDWSTRAIAGSPQQAQIA